MHHKPPSARPGAILLASLLGTTSCSVPPDPAPRAQAVYASSVQDGAGEASAGQRVNGSIGAMGASFPIQTSLGRPADLDRPGGARSPSAGDVTLDFAETDIREVAAQILGNILKVNYSIDPAVRGVATFKTTQPLPQSRLLATLQMLLAQNGAALVRADALYRVVPAAARGGAMSLGDGEIDATSGSSVVALRYASAEELAKVLQPLVGTAGRVAADPGRNMLLIDGDPATRETVMSLLRAFDTNALAGQSYALMPVAAGSVKDYATTMQDALRVQSGGALASLVRVLPMERANAVLVVSSQPRYVDEARRIFSVLERARNLSVRSWHALYLQNSRVNDVANVLQRAFTPNDVTAEPDSTTGRTAPGQATQTTALGGNQGGFGGPSGQGGIGGGGGQGGGISGMLGGTQAGSILGGAGQQGQGLAAAGALDQSAQPSANPLLGGLSATRSGGDANPDALRIIPNVQNNAILVFATSRENDTIEAMVRKIDILPLQVRIDAVIAEVTLNDSLKYGTQFFFKSGGLNGVLSTGTQFLGNVPLGNATFGTTLPGFVLGGTGLGGAPAVLSALQAVTSVQVLSSPELMVVDNHPARLQVGNVVPYLSQTSQSTLASNAPVINSINYQQTGVIMQVIPRVNSGGLVTLDISQEVSDVATNVTTEGINSPTFLQRSVNSRVVIQDGQTLGLAGLIRDNVTKSNGGIPWLKDVPILGLLAGQQNNTRERTELIILITPHVVHDMRDARALTADLRDSLGSAAAVQDKLQNLQASGSADPSEPTRRRLRLQP